MKQIINIIVDNDGYLIAKPGQDGEYQKVMPQGIQRIPCIPFYQTAWFVMGNDVRPAIQDFAQAANLLYGGINKASALVACPADALPADQIMMKETFEVAGIKKVKIISKTSLGEAMRYSNYIAISVSERLLIVEWYKDNVVAEAKYYNKAAISKKKLFGDILSIKQRSESKVKILIFDSCNELGGIYDLGKVIDGKKTMQLLNIMSEVIYKKKSIKDLVDDEECKADADYSEEEEQVIPRDIVFDDQENGKVKNSNSEQAPTPEVKKDTVDEVANKENNVSEEVKNEKEMTQRVTENNVSEEAKNEKEMTQQVTEINVSKEAKNEKEMTQQVTEINVSEDDKKGNNEANLGNKKLKKKKRGKR